MELSQLKIRVQDRVRSHALHCRKKLQVVRIAELGDLGEISIGRRKGGVILRQEQSGWFIQWFRAMQINSCYGEKIFKLGVAGRILFVACLGEAQEKLVFYIWRSCFGNLLHQL